MYKIAFTGHRPHKISDAKAIIARIRDFLEHQLSLHPDLLVISGGALGVDQYAAKICIDLDIPFKLILPFPVAVLTSRWSNNCREYLRYLMHHAEKTSYIQQEFSMAGYQRRNEVMVNHCNLLCAVFNGSSGGTANCINYARSVGTAIHIINPKEDK